MELEKKLKSVMEVRIMESEKTATNNVEVGKQAYREYLEKWLDGIVSEIGFWDNYFMTRGSGWKLSYEEQISYERKFTLEDYLNENGTYAVLEVGSGPLPSCGSLTDKAKLSIKAVDPLAEIYKRLLRKHSVKTKILPEYGVVECLSEQFGEDRFDIVHMRNALDHSFAPLTGISQMLNVCKIGGKIILEHNDNEAERGGYRGFHQWNLEVTQKGFEIWRGDIRVNVGQWYHDFIDIDTEMAEEKGCLHKVIITKRKRTVLEGNPFQDIYREMVFNRLLSLILDEYLLDQFKEEIAWHKDAELCMGENIVIFGAGRRGMWIYNILKDNVLCICDNDSAIHGLRIEDTCVLSVQEAAESYPDAVYVVASENCRQEMAEQLQREGIPKTSIRFFPKL